MSGFRVIVIAIGLLVVIRVVIVASGADANDCDSPCGSNWGIVLGVAWVIALCAGLIGGIAYWAWRLLRHVRARQAGDTR